MRRILLIFLLLASFLNIYASATKDTVVTKAYLQSLEGRIQKTEVNELSQLDDKIKSLEDELDRSYASLANLVAASSNNLDYWGYFLTGFGIIITVVIAWMQVKTAKNLQRSKHTLELQRKAKNEVLELQRMIEKNPSELYKKLQLAEVDYLVARLEKEPLVVDRLFDRLVMLPLSDRYAERIYKITEKLHGADNSGVRAKIDDLILQLFPDLWLAYPFMREIYARNASTILSKLDDAQVEKKLSDIILHIKYSEPDESDIAVCVSFFSSYVSGSASALLYVISDGRFVGDEKKIDARLRKFYNGLEKKELKFRFGEEFFAANSALGMWYVRYLKEDYNSSLTTSEQELFYRTDVIINDFLFNEEPPFSDPEYGREYIETFFKEAQQP